MAAKVYVCVQIHGCVQFYQRDVEQKRNGHWTAVPTFVRTKEEATAMLEESGRALVRRLRLLKEDPWLQDAAGNRIDVPEEATQNFVEDERVPMVVTLDQKDWYLVFPANTPDGPRWFARANVPGRVEPDTIYGTTMIAVLERARDLKWLEFCEKAPAPQASVPRVRKPSGPRVRPGDRI